MTEALYARRERPEPGPLVDQLVMAAPDVWASRFKSRFLRILPNLANDRAFVTMFLNEARIASTLQHPNIVQTLDVIDDRGEYYIAMELLEGVTLLELRQRLYRQGHAPTAGQVLYIVDRVLAGLHYAHERRSMDDRPMQLVHRDVSPHNVFLTLDGSVKLLDFGVAKLMDSDERPGDTLTIAGQPIGTPSYMAPEQLSGRAVTAATDIYALGVMAYEMLSGHTPFGPGPIAEIAIRQRDGAPRLDLLEAIPPGMAGAIASALDADPGRRPVSAEAFATALR